MSFLLLKKTEVIIIRFKFLSLIFIMILISSILLCSCQTGTTNNNETQSTSEVENTTEAESMALEDSLEPILFDTPSFEYYLSDSVNVAAGSPLTLNLVSSKKNGITDTDLWFENNDLYVGGAQSNNGLRLTSYNDGVYRYEIDTYGNKVNIYDLVSNEWLYNFDFNNFGNNGFPLGAYGMTASHAIKWVLIKDDILYISDVFEGYSVDAGGKTAYITAINLSDMSILWRTEPLTCYCTNFIILNNVIICGYGFTAEDDYIYQVDLNTGVRLASIKVDTMAEYFAINDNVLYVRCYDTDYEFEIVD